MYDLLPLLWPGSGAPMQRCTVCCLCFADIFPLTLTVEPEIAKFRGQGVLTLGGALILVGSDYPSKTADG